MTEQNEKQAIEEMTEDMVNVLMRTTRFDEDENAIISCDKMAAAFYRKGYRKQIEGEWISVDERLPKDGETVLTISSEEEMAVCFYETELEGIFQQCHGLVQIYNITHWMPLPEPPKMKGDAE